VTSLNLALVAAFGALHFGFWFVTMAVGRLWWLPLALLSVATATRCVFWLCRGDGPAAGARVGGEQDTIGRLLLSAALSAIAVLLLIWFPSRPNLIAHSQNLSSLTVRLERGGGQGNLPRYSVAVSGDGEVTYEGKWLVGKRGLQTARIPGRQVQILAAELDRIGFFGIDGRTLPFSTHGAWTTISVSIGGREKTLTYTGGSAPWTQQKAVNGILAVAREIDGLAGSDRWTRCDSTCLPVVRNDR
jgi:hypothetical protein